MRILHTSDWHLGRTFHGRVLDDAQAIFADHLVELARTEAVDAVVISGDVYDRAIPPTNSVLLLDATLRRLVGSHSRQSRLRSAARFRRRPAAPGARDPHPHRGGRPPRHHPDP